MGESSGTSALYKASPCTGEDKKTSVSEPERRKHLPELGGLAIGVPEGISFTWALSFKVGKSPQKKAVSGGKTPTPVLTLPRPSIRTG